jgi:hypothetical protein
MLGIHQDSPRFNRATVSQETARSTSAFHVMDGDCAIGIVRWSAGRFSEAADHREDPADPVVEGRGSAVPPRLAGWGPGGWLLNADLPSRPLSADGVDAVEV